MGIEAERVIAVSTSNNQRQVETKEVVDKLRFEEDKLRREQLEMTSASDDPIADKERMILMQQKKIAALDAANKRLLEELTRISSTGPVGSSASSSNTVGGSSAIASGAKVSVTTSPINVTSINTSSNTVSHDRRVSSSSTSSNKSITVITNGEATMCIPKNGGTSGT